MLKVLNARQWREVPWRPIAGWLLALVAAAWAAGFAAGLVARIVSAR